jgi:hypothetical protein
MMVSDNVTVVIMGLLTRYADGLKVSLDQFGVLAKVTRPLGALVPFVGEIVEFVNAFLDLGWDGRVNCIVQDSHFSVFRINGTFINTAESQIYAN